MDNISAIQKKLLAQAGQLPDSDFGPSLPPPPLPPRHETTSTESLENQDSKLAKKRKFR